jgi:hypothetical protein
MSVATAEPVKWTISVTREMDVELRTHLASTGAKKGDLSRFVAEAVRWRLAEINVASARAHNADVDPDVLEAEIERALGEVRADRFSKSV